MTDAVAMIFAFGWCILATTTTTTTTTTTSAWVPPTVLTKTPLRESALSATTSIFSATSATSSLEQLKYQILQLGAAMDRGQAYNPTSGEYDKTTMEMAEKKIEQLLRENPNQHAKALQDMEGEWELVLSTVPHGIFWSSPFVLAVQEAFSYAEEKGKNNNNQPTNQPTYLAPVPVPSCSS